MAEDPDKPDPAFQSPADPSPPPPPSRLVRDPHAQALQTALRRAMPIQRLLGGGMRRDDARTLHRLSATGHDWVALACWLGDRNARLAERSPTRVGQRAFYRYASACYRAAQAAIATDTDEKRRLYARMVALFGHACRLDTPPTEKLDMPWRGGKLCGWLMWPHAVTRPPVVIVMGGFDGWREEYWPGAEALRQRGLAVYLVDGPGQGETRLMHGLYLGADYHLAYQHIVDMLLADERLGERIGIWGNSLGGHLAAHVAAHDARIAAVCVNGGTLRPAELPERFPRFWEKVEALGGVSSQPAAAALLAHLDLSVELARLTAPLLQLHSVPDQVFLLANARQLHDGAASTDRQLLIWDDGDHCIYNHSEEKFLLVGDWFAERLAAADTH